MKSPMQPALPGSPASMCFPFPACKMSACDAHDDPTFSFTCKGRGLTVRAASVSRGLPGLGAGRGLGAVLAV